MLPRIYTISPVSTTELSARLHTYGLETVSTAAADIILLDATNADLADALDLLPFWAQTAATPVVVLARTPPILVPGHRVAGWLTPPIDDRELIGALRAIFAAQAASSQLDTQALRQQLAAVEADRDALALADQKKDEFISYISHELKNPMASIKGYADLMRRRSAKLTEDPNRKGLEIISNQVGRMTVLLDQLIDYSRISLDRLQLDLRPLNLVALAQRLVDETQNLTDRHAIQLVIEVQPMPIQADENRLRQALLAIASNAIKFSPEAGTIVVRVSQSAANARIAVADKGIGVPKAEQSAIFERFARGSNAGDQHSGLGLGLFLAREIVTRHDGVIELESTVGSGSTFTIALPVNVV